MAERTYTGGQPTMQKLAADGIPLRKCISYTGLGEYPAGGRGRAPAGQPAAPSAAAPPKPQPVLASVVRKGRSGY